MPFIFGRFNRSTGEKLTFTNVLICSSGWSLRPLGYFVLRTLVN